MGRQAPMRLLSFFELLKKEGFSSIEQFQTIIIVNEERLESAKLHEVHKFIKELRKEFKQHSIGYYIDERGCN